MKNILNSRNKLVVLSVLFLFIFVISGCKESGQQRQKRKPEVTVSKLKKQKIRLSTTYSGEAVADKSVKLYAKVKGYLTKKNFVAGDYVKKGQLLYQISKKPYKIDVQSAKAALDKALYDLNNTKDILKMYQKLLPKGAAKEKQYYEARLKNKQAKAEVLACKAKLKRAKLHLNYTEIKAPFAGYVEKSDKYVGDLIRQYKYQGGGLVKMHKTDPIKVEFSIPEEYATSLTQKYAGQKKDAGDLSPNTIVKLILPNGSEYKHEGKIDYISVKVNKATGTNLVRAKFPNPKHIVFPGAYVTVKLKSRKKINELIVPQIAVLEDQQGKYVYTVDKNNKVHKRHINLGIPYKTGFIVKKGLKEGETIITKGVQMVHQGMTVKPSEGKSVSAILQSEEKEKQGPQGSSVFNTMFLSQDNTDSKKGTK